MSALYCLLKEPMKQQAATLLWVAIYTFLFLPLAPLRAQSIHPVADGPVRIQHRPFEQPVRPGEPLEIEAVISASTPVEAALLYRKIGASEYTPLQMRHQGEGRYTARIPKRDVVSPGLQYVIQVTDRDGNMTTFGQPAPLGVIELKPFIVQTHSPEDQRFTERIFSSGPETAADEEAVASGTPWYKKWWVWTIVGAVAAGVAVASGGGGGGDSGGGAPPTGTITLSGPTPKSP